MKKFSKAQKLGAAALSVALVGTMAIGGTMAFLTDKEEKTNVFTVGHIDMSFAEPDWDPDHPGPDGDVDGQEIVPGRVTDKTPTITSSNDATNRPMYVRFKMELVDKATGARITDANRINLIMNCIRYDSADTILKQTIGSQGAGKKYTQAEIEKCKNINPMFKEDKTYTAATPGLYYFNYVGPDGKIDAKGADDKFGLGAKAELFTHIVVPTDYTNAELEKLGNFDIKLMAQAIQEEGFLNATEAFAALQEKYDNTNGDFNDKRLEAYQTKNTLDAKTQYSGN